MIRGIKMAGVKIVLLAVIATVLAMNNPLNAANSQVVAGVDTSKWRGFNLLEKFTLGRNSPFREDDFKWISELGFNFVRLPMDYRCYTEKDDWSKFRESALKEIDEAIEFGKRYHIHVCINLHRAPGYCINPPEEPTNLWTDEKTQETFAAHWAMFARRYKGIPSEQLSFNLLNEPARSSKEQYLRVFRRAISAIHEIDPNRLVMVDGMNVGKDPVPEFVPLPNVMQACRGYAPGRISHYKASWVKGSDQWPEPTWPLVNVNGMLFGTSKPEFKSPLVIEGDLKAGTSIAIKIHSLSVKAVLEAKADGKALAVKVCDPKADPASWKVIPTEQRYTFHEPAKPTEFKVTLPENARTFSLENTNGDWLKFSAIVIQQPGGKTLTFAADPSWGKKQETWKLTNEGLLLPTKGNPEAVLDDYLKPWLDISRQGETVFVGEWGSFSKTPHPVVLAWMRAWLERWKQAGFGWALWNFRGSFGILDSGRADVEYEDWRGHKLDRKMLNLLQEYAK